MYICLHTCVYLEKCRSIYYVFILCICTLVYCHSICRPLQHTATHCNTPLHKSIVIVSVNSMCLYTCVCIYDVCLYTCLSRQYLLRVSVAVCCSVLQCVSVCLYTFLSRQYLLRVSVAVCCSVLQCVAVCLYTCLSRQYLLRVSPHMCPQSHKYSMRTHVHVSAEQ